MRRHIASCLSALCVVTCCVGIAADKNLRSAPAGRNKRRVDPRIFHLEIFAAHVHAAVSVPQPVADLQKLRGAGVALVVR